MCDPIQDGLKDHYDIKMLTYLMLARVAQLCPGMVLSRLDKLVEPLKLTVTTKVKANSVKQEFEKQDELKRSALRSLAALMVIPGADKHPQLNEFLSQASDCGAWYQSTKCYYSNWYLGVSTRATRFFGGFTSHLFWNLWGIYVWP